MLSTTCSQRYNNPAGRMPKTTSSAPVISKGVHVVPSLQLHVGGAFFHIEINDLDNTQMDVAGNDRCEHRENRKPVCSGVCAMSNT